jgi:glycosyltransferase involved in cell wall biosynthesis
VASAAEKVLFVADDAEWTPATLGLLQLVRWIRQRTELDFEVLLLADGPLEVELRRVARIWRPEEVEAASWLGRVATTVDGWGATGVGARLRRHAQRRGLRRIRGVGALWFASPAALQVLPSLRRRSRPVVCVVPEAEPRLVAELDGGVLRLLEQEPDRYLVGTDDLARSFAAAHDVAPEAISVHPLVVEPAHELRPERAPRPASALLVGGSGPLRWDEAPDLFVDLAALVHRRRPDLPVRWVWTGGRPHVEDHRAVVEDVQALPAGVVLELEPDDDARVRPQDLDLFVATGREDRPSAKAVEAAAAGVPVVCFASAGLAALVGPDRVGPDRAGPDRADPDGASAGIVVAHGDLGGLADAVIHVLEDPAQGDELGRRAVRRLRHRHAPEVVFPALLDDLGPLIDPVGRLVSRA